MAKVVTSEGLTDFVQTGKATETIVDKRQRAGAAAPLEMKAVIAPVTEVGNEPKAVIDEPKKDDDTGLEADDHDLAERAKKRIGKKHYEMKTAQADAAKARAEAEESERFAETLFNERESWRKKAEELERQSAAPAKEAPPAFVKPDPNDAKYKDTTGEFKWREFSDDNAEYAAKKAIADDRKAQADAKSQADQAAAEAAFKKRVEAASKKNPDWQEVVSKSPVFLPNEALQYIAQSEYGTDLAYFLAKNEDIAEKIRVMHPIRAIAELGKLEISFEKPATKTAPTGEATSKTVERPGAPAPITPISMQGTSTINTDPARMIYKELRAYERARAQKKH
jgi:hypothetical protein